MRQFIQLLVLAGSIVATSACAVDPVKPADPADPADSTELDSADLTMAGWTVIDGATAPLEAATAPLDGAAAASVVVIFTSTGASCPSGFVCLYQNSNHGGAGWGISSGGGFANLKGEPCGQCTNGIHGNDGTFNDQMSSWQNHSGRRYCWYFDASFSGEHHPMVSGAGTQNVFPRENDRASSLRPC